MHLYNLTCDSMTGCGGLRRSNVTNFSLVPALLVNVQSIVRSSVAAMSGEQQHFNARSRKIQVSLYLVTKTSVARNVEIHPSSRYT
ncbi:uncharacterized protein LAESUDRAFT_93458 [Laetiporus sulphureus 93-53]|uniref:Uncharacterized protein n=1 Tax=Laetiporus sulphureus 93-53 TaxID=1314785 RepID=A0A165EZH9_9APHY|nr:uncharacterized protein LAESUDRAFT_93458 [Laetiporus sulphureus 93-53]KZT08047.1 hypothetical protein LAESUDRAFT_93458 [Laetiporus sulphureus 93-53]